MKFAIIVDQEHGTYGLEYDNNLGNKNVMRLDATTYLKAIQEAKSFLGINEENLDAAGDLWVIE